MQKTELAVALDVSSLAQASEIARKLPEHRLWIKIGLELFCAEGPRVLEPFQARKQRVFLDLKLHDIPRTAGRAARAAALHGCDLLTIHASGGREMIRAAADAAHEASSGRTRIVAVTALTSLSDDDLRSIHVRIPIAAHVDGLARLAIESGADGLVCSPLEVARLRAALGPQPLLVTPGIRSSGDTKGDQKRTATAAEAARNGASLLVVGRPIVEAPDPGAAARAFLDEIATATR